MKKSLLFTLSLSAFSIVAVSSAMAQINPLHERFEKVYPISFTRLTPQGPESSGGSTLSTDLGRKNSTKYRASRGYINLNDFANDVSKNVFSEGSSLQKAQLLHSLLYDINALKRQLTYLNTNILNARVQERRLDDFEACAKKRLSNSFLDAEALWNAIKEEAIALYNGKVESSWARADLSRFEREYYSGTPSEESSETDQTRENDVTDETSETTFEDEIKTSEDILSNWLLARRILVNLYENQDDYGKRVCTNGRCPSLPVWEDQKYIYDETVWEPKYKEIKAKIKEVCQITWDAKPDVTPEQKYDYYYYDEVKAAHTAFINAIPPKCRAKLEALNIAGGKLLDPPAQIDRPLPPVGEYVALITDSKGRLGDIYPAIPKPWEKMLELNPVCPSGSLNCTHCTKINKGGEMDQKFHCDPSTGQFSLRKEVIQNSQSLKDMDKKSNKLVSGSLLSQFYSLYSEKVNADSMLAEYIDLVEKISETMESYAEVYKVKIMPKEPNFYTEKGLNKIFEKIKDAQDKELEKVLKSLGQRGSKKKPTVEELKADPEFAMYYALSKDTTGDMDVTESSAPYVKTFVDELNNFRNRYGGASAGEGLVAALQGINDAAGNDEYKKMAGLIVLQEITRGDVESMYKAKILEKVNIKLDTMCQNGGIKGSFDSSDAKGRSWLDDKIKAIRAEKEKLAEETRKIMEEIQKELEESQNSKEVLVEVQEDVE